jgi:predicted transcriptional regulator
VPISLRFILALKIISWFRIRVSNESGNWKWQKFIKRQPVFVLYSGKTTCETGESEATRMRRSKLETFIDILNTLARLGPLKMTHIMHKTNVNGNMLKGHLDFLIKQGLVEERTLKRSHSVFAITQRGITVVKHFQELTHMVSIIEEAQS